MKGILGILKERKIRRAFVRAFILVHSKMRAFYYRTLFSDNSPLLIECNILQATQYVGKGKIDIKHSQLGVWPSPGLLVGCGYIEARSELAEIVIAEYTVLNNNFIIIADKCRIEIGKRCLIGPNFFVTDSDFHGLTVSKRFDNDYECKSVLIEDDVFIGEGVKVLKGVTIAHGSVIGSGSVVVKDVEPNCIYAGVPARKITSLSCL